MKIGQTVERKDTFGNVTTFLIKNETDLSYHNDLSILGFKYTVLFNDDFDLPVMSATKPRIHLAGEDSTCTACES